MPKNKQRYWLRLGTFTLVVVVIAAIAGLAILIQLQITVLVTPVRLPVTRTPADIGFPFEDVTLTTRDGLKLPAWYIPGRRPQAIILVHGINANRSLMLPTAKILAEAGFPLLMLDLRGHGQSDTSLNSYGYREALDVQAGVDFLSGRPEIKRIGAIGSSLGGAAVARAAAADPRLEAVVIQISYSSLPDAVNDAFEHLTIFPQWPFAPLIVNLAERRVGIEIGQVDSSRALATLSPRPVLIIHSTDDHLFPLDHGQKMFEAAGDPKELWIMESLGHDDPAKARPAEYRRRVVTFFETALAQ